jgi:phosphoglycerate kinase
MIVASKAYSVAGGGDTISAAEKAGVLDKLDYVSTAGGAFLEFIEGRKLPALEALMQK